MAADPNELTDGAQDYPGSTAGMDPEPHDEMRHYAGRGLLSGRRALVTGGDSDIGRAVCAAFAKEGADVVISYLEELDDARHTAGLVEAEGRKAVLLPPDSWPPSYVFFASEFSSYSTGEVLGALGGETHPG